MKETVKVCKSSIWTKNGSNQEHEVERTSSTLKDIKVAKMKRKKAKKFSLLEDGK